MPMKKGLIYYFVLASVLFHLLVLLGLRHIPWQKARFLKKDKEPIAIDIVGPLKKGKETAIPRFPEKPPERGPSVVQAEPKKVRPKEPLMTARVLPQRPAPPSPPPAPAVKPRPVPAPEQKSATAPTRPEPPTPAPKPPEAPSKSGTAAPAKPEAGVLSAVQPHARTPVQSGATGAERPAQTGTNEAPRRLVQPTVEDLMRYAKVDKDVKRVKPEQGITLDTNDLMYTSYLRGLKRRIEMVWRYPDTAQRDGLQGELVMRFSIAKSGKVESIELLKSSGYPLLDNAAEKALADASPFNPLPDSWNKERFVITGTFIYRLYGLYLE